MIDINSYRSRIGTFSQCGKSKSNKFNKYFSQELSKNDKTARLTLSVLQAAIKIVLLFSLLQPCLYQPPNQVLHCSPSGQSCCWSLPVTRSTQSLLGGEAWLQETKAVVQFRVRGTKETCNFRAKYELFMIC